MLTQPTTKSQPIKVVNRCALVENAKVATTDSVSHPSSLSPDDLTIEKSELTLQMDTVLANSPAFADLISQLARIIQSHSECLALWVSLPNEEGNFQAFRSVTDVDEDPVWDVAGPNVEMVAHFAIESGQVAAQAVSDSSQVVVVPVRDPANPQARPLALWAGCFSTVDQTAVRQQWLLSMMGQTTATWFQVRNGRSLEQRSQQLSEAMSCMMSLNQADSLEQVTMTLVNQLRKSFSARQIAIALGSQPNGLMLQAISDVEQVDLEAESTKVVQHACTAAGEAGKPILWPVAEGDDPVPALALKEYCDVHQSEAALAIPLQTAAGDLVGTLLIACDAAQLATPGYLDNVARFTGMVAGQLSVAIRANRSVGQMVVDQWRSLKKSNWSRYALSAAIGLCLLMCVPLPYRVGCDCSVQPVQRRYVSAPYNGILERSTVKIGDVVTTGQVLATMDGANLRSELAGLIAELKAAQQRRDSALAQGEVAQSQIARSEMKRHQSKIEIISQQLTDLEIRSPIDGMVVKGDLEKVQGAPLEMGQTVFEVAPLENMLAEIEIDEAEIQYVRAGMPVKIKLNAFPFRSWTGMVKSIHPGTEVVNNESVFMAEVELPNDELQLRPGMKGSAKIRGDLATLGWSLFHRPWETVRYWSIW